MVEHTLQVRDEEIKNSLLLLKETVEGIMIEMYRNISLDIEVHRFSKDDYPFVFIGELLEHLYQEVYAEIKVDLVHEAIDRGDYEIYGMSRDEFALHAYNEQIRDESLYPHFGREDIEVLLRQILTEKNLAYLDYDLTMQNEVIKEVW